MEQPNYHYTQEPTVSFGDAIRNFYSNYFNFRSRSRRSDGVVNTGGQFSMKISFYFLFCPFSRFHPLLAYFFFLSP